MKRRGDDCGVDKGVRELGANEDWVEAYEEAGGVLVIRAGTKMTDSSVVENLLDERHLAALYESLDERDHESFTVENASDTTVKNQTFLDFTVPARGYCSFIVQHDEPRKVLDRIPAHLPESGHKVRFGSAIWVFMARNKDGPILHGRPPHTDSVTHDGTCHLQLRGSKEWHLSRKGVGKFSVLVSEGDRIVVDTKNWMHNTSIAQQEVSLSFARDIYLGRDVAEEDMTNVDALFAVEDIEAGTLLFKADENPDLELGRSNEPNCEVVELQDGTLAIVTTRAIASGEFFTVEHSEEEEEEN